MTASLEASVELSLIFPVRGENGEANVATIGVCCDSFMTMSSFSWTKAKGTRTHGLISTFRWLQFQTAKPPLTSLTCSINWQDVPLMPSTSSSWHICLESWWRWSIDDCLCSDFKLHRKMDKGYGYERTLMTTGKWNTQQLSYFTGPMRFQYDIVCKIL